MKSQSAIFDESSVCLIDPEKVLPGDVVLTRNPKSPISHAIQAATGSEFSHAFLITNPPMAVESTPRGVTRFKINRLMIDDRANVRVLRLKNRDQYRESLKKIVAHAEHAIAREYATADAALSVFRSVPQIQEGQYFCSQLVADVYLRERIELLPGMKASKVTPGALLSSPLLSDVTAEAVRRPSFLEYRFADGIVTGDIDAAYVNEIRVRQQMARALSAEMARYGFAGQTLEEVVAFVLAAHIQKWPFAQEVDALVDNALHEYGLVEYWQRHVPSAVYYFDLDMYELMNADPRYFKLTAQQHRDLFAGMLADKEKTVDYWRNDVQQLHQVVAAITGRPGTYFTLLRISEERYWSTLRMLSTVHRTIAFIDAFLASEQQQSDGVAGGSPELPPDSA